jgi:hypothetical protein
MGVEPGEGRDDVVVADEQEAVVGVLGVVVVAEAEAVAGVEPAGAGAELLLLAADVDGRRHGRPSEWSRAVLVASPGRAPSPLVVHN